MNRDGVALIEVLVALVILALTGISTVTYASAVADARTFGVERELELERAENLMIEHVLLDHRDLIRRLGARRAGEFVVWIDRPRPALFRVGVARSDRPEVELLATLVHRPSTLPGADG